MVPPYCSTNRFTIGIPNPVPFSPLVPRRVVCFRGSKSFPRMFSGIPMPVSSISIFQPRSPSLIRRVMLPPRLVNLTAFEMRLLRTWYAMPVRSPLTNIGTSPIGRSSLHWMPLVCIASCCRNATSLMVLLRST